MYINYRCFVLYAKKRRISTSSCVKKIKKQNSLYIQNTRKYLIRLKMFIQYTKTLRAVLIIDNGHTKKLYFFTTVFS